MCRELEQHLARARQTARQTASEELEATGGSKVRFTVEGKRTRQSQQPATSITNSLQHDHGLHHLLLLTFLYLYFILALSLAILCA